MGTAEKEAMHASIRLPATVDIASVSVLYDDLKKALEAGNRISVQADQVERITTPGMQVMVAAARAAEDAGVSLTVEAPSSAFREALADLGLEFMLKLNEA